MAHLKRPNRLKAPVRDAVRFCGESAALSSPATSKCRQSPRPRTAGFRSIGPTATKSNKLRIQARLMETAYSARVTHDCTTTAMASATASQSETSTKYLPAPTSVVSRRSSTAPSAFCVDGSTGAERSAMGKEAGLNGVKFFQKGSDRQYYDKVEFSTSIPDSSDNEDPVPYVRNSKISNEIRQNELNETSCSGAGSQTALSSTGKSATESTNSPFLSHVANFSASVCDDPAHRALLPREQIQQRPEKEGELQRQRQEQVRGRHEEQCKYGQLHQQWAHQRQYVRAETVIESFQRCSGEEKQSGETKPNHVCQRTEVTHYASSSEKGAGHPPSNSLHKQQSKTSSSNTKAMRAELPELSEHSDSDITLAQLQTKELYELLEAADPERALSLPASSPSEKRRALSEGTLQSRVNLPLFTEEMDESTLPVSCGNNIPSGASSKNDPLSVQSEDPSHLWGFAHRLDYILDKLLQSQWTSPRNHELCVPDSDGDTEGSDASPRAGHTLDFDVSKTAVGTRCLSGPGNTCDPAQRSRAGTFSSSHILPKSSAVCRQAALTVKYKSPSTQGGPALEAASSSLGTKDIGQRTLQHEEDHPKSTAQKSAAHCLSNFGESRANKELGSPVSQRDVEAGSLARRRVAARSMEASAAGILSSPSRNRDRARSASPSAEGEEVAISCRTISTKEGVASRSCHTDDARERELQNFVENDEDTDCSSHSLDRGNDVGETKRLALVRQARMYPAVRGVYFDTRSGNLSWRCSWKTEGKKRSRSWSVLKFGMEGARAYAIAERLSHHSKACHTDDIAREFLRCFRTKRESSLLGGRLLHPDSPPFCATKSSSDSEFPDGPSVPRTEKRSEKNSTHSSISHYSGRLQHRDNVLQSPSPSASRARPGATGMCGFNTVKYRIPQHTSAGGTASEAASSVSNSSEHRRTLLQTNTSQCPQGAGNLDVTSNSSHLENTPTYSSMSLQNSIDATLRLVAGRSQIGDSHIDRSATAPEATRSFEYVSPTVAASPSGTVYKKDNDVSSRILSHSSASLNAFISSPASSREPHLFASLLSPLDPSLSMSESSSCDYSTGVEQTLPPSKERSPSDCAVAVPSLEACTKRRKVQSYRESATSLSEEKNANRYPALLSSARQMYLPETCELSCPQEVMQTHSAPKSNKEGISNEQVFTRKNLTHHFRHDPSPVSGEQTLDTSVAGTSAEPTSVCCADHEKADTAAACGAKLVASLEEESRETCQDDEANEKEKKVRERRQTAMCRGNADMCKQTCETAETDDVAAEKRLIQLRQHQRNSTPRCSQRTTSGSSPATTAQPSATFLPHAMSVCLPTAAALADNRLPAPCASSSAAGATTEAAHKTAAATQRSNLEEMQESMQHQVSGDRERVPLEGPGSAQRICRKRSKDTDARDERIGGESMEKDIRRGGKEESIGDSGREDTQAIRSRSGSQCNLNGTSVAMSQRRHCSEASQSPHQRSNLEEECNAVSLFWRRRSSDCEVEVARQGQRRSRSDTETPSAAREAEVAVRTKEARDKSAPPAVSTMRVSLNCPPPEIHQQHGGIETVCPDTTPAVGESVQGPTPDEVSGRGSVETATGRKPVLDSHQPVISSEHLQHGVRGHTKVTQYAGDVSASHTGTDFKSSSCQLPLASGHSSLESLHAAASIDDDEVTDGVYAEDDGFTENAESNGENNVCPLRKSVMPASLYCETALPETATTEERCVGERATVLRGAEGSQTSASAPSAANIAKLSKTWPSDTILETTPTPSASACCETDLTTRCTGDVSPLSVISGQEDDKTLSKSDTGETSRYALTSTEDSPDSVGEKEDAGSSENHFAAVKTTKKTSKKNERVSIEKLYLPEENSSNSWRCWRDISAATVAPSARAALPKPYYDATPTTAPSPTARESSIEGGSAGARGVTSLSEKKTSVSFSREAAWKEEEAGRCPVNSPGSTWGAREIDSQEQKMKRSERGETLEECYHNSNRTSASSTKDKTRDAESVTDGPDSVEERLYIIDGGYVKEDAFTTNNSLPGGNRENPRSVSSDSSAVIKQMDTGGEHYVQTGESNNEPITRRVVLLEGLLKLRKSLEELPQLPANESAKQKSSENPVANSPLILVFPRDGEPTEHQRCVSGTAACPAEMVDFGSGGEVQGVTVSWCVKVFDELIGTLRLSVGTSVQESLKEKTRSENTVDEVKDIANPQEKATTLCQEREGESLESVEQLEKTVFLLLSGFLQDILVSAPALLRYKRNALLAALITCFLNWKRLRSY